MNASIDFHKVIQSPEYDFLRTDPRLGDNIILLGLGGSHSYGTNIEGVSDVDIRSVAANSKEEILLHRDWGTIVDVETDTVIYSFEKIVKLLMENNPNTLEIVFQRPEDYIVLTELGKLLVDVRHAFLSKRCFYTFGGYAQDQLRRLDNKSMRELPQDKQEVHILHSIENAMHTYREKYFEYPEDAIRLYVDESDREGMLSEIFMDIHLTHYPLRDYKCMWSEMHNIVKDYAKIGKRASNAITHNKINKHAMHLVRLLLCAIDILETGTFSTYCGNKIPLLMDIRNGKYMGEDGQMLPAFHEMVAELNNKLTLAFERTELPDKPDYDRINRFKAEVNYSVITNTQFPIMEEVR